MGITDPKARVIFEDATDKTALGEFQTSLWDSGEGLHLRFTLTPDLNLKVDL